jgi:hypothetical protein
LRLNDTEKLCLIEWRSRENSVRLAKWNFEENGTMLGQWAFPSSAGSSSLRLTKTYSAHSFLTSMLAWKCWERFYTSWNIHVGKTPGLVLRAEF